MSRSEALHEMADALYCGHCGRDLTDADHEVCADRLRLEPPRYCAHCRRRMVVQVTPRTWTATCVEHGIVSNV